MLMSDRAGASGRTCGPLTAPTPTDIAGAHGIGEAGFAAIKAIQVWEGRGGLRGHQGDAGVGYYVV